MTGSDRVHDPQLVDDDNPNYPSSPTTHTAHTALVGLDVSMEDIDRVQDQGTSIRGDRDKPRMDHSLTYDADQIQGREVDDRRDSHDLNELVAWQKTPKDDDRVQVRITLDDPDGRFKPEPEIDGLMVEDNLDRSQENRSVINATEDDLRERLSPGCSPIDEYLGFSSQSHRRISSIASSIEGHETLGFESDEERDNEPSLDDLIRFLNQQQIVLNAAAATAAASTTPTPTPPLPPSTQPPIPPLADHLDRDDHETLASSRSLQSAKITPSSPPERLAEGGVSTDDPLITNLDLGGIQPDKQAMEETARLDFFNASDAFQTHLIDSQPSMILSDFPLSVPMDPYSIDIPVPSLLETNPSEGLTEGPAHALPQPTITRDSQAQAGQPVDPIDVGEVESDPEDETYDPKLDKLRTIDDESVTYSSASDEDDDLEARVDWEESDSSLIGVPPFMNDDHLDGSRLGHFEASLRYAGLKDYVKEFKRKIWLKMKSLKAKVKMYRRGYLKKSSALKLLRSRLKNRDDRILELELDFRSSLDDLHRSIDDLERSQLPRALQSSRESLMASKYQIAILVEKLKLFELIKLDLESENDRLKQRITSLEASIKNPFNQHLRQLA